MSFLIKRPEEGIRRKNEKIKIPWAITKALEQKGPIRSRV